MNNILYINSTVRKKSRTDELAKHLIKQLQGNVTEIKLEDENIKPLNEMALIERDKLVCSNNLTDAKIKYARQFANADSIIISAPFWDLSFPSMLKVYIENISVVGITFKYDEKGRPVGLCKANKIFFVSTAGGKFLPDFGYNYIKMLTKDLFGIKNSELFYAEGLDIYGNNTSEIMNRAKEDIIKKIKKSLDLDER